MKIKERGGEKGGEREDGEVRHKKEMISQDQKVAVCVGGRGQACDMNAKPTTLIL